MAAGGTDDPFRSPAALSTALTGAGYLPDTGLSTVTYLAHSLSRPLFLEGEPGVGKTALALALAELRGVDLIRLQCYEGIDASQALYDWDFPRQILHLRAVEAVASSAPAGRETGSISTATGGAGPSTGTGSGTATDGTGPSLGSATDGTTTGTADATGSTTAAGSGNRADLLAAVEADLYSERFLIARPILAALRTPRAVLLIDEIDRADDEFEAFLLEVLSEFAVTIPELGRVQAVEPPLVVVTSNRTREVHDALKRRCLYHWVEHPSLEREVEILRLRLPHVTHALAVQVATAVGRLRKADLLKPPGVAESLDWARALQALGCDRLDAESAAVTLGAVLKYREDTERVTAAGVAALFPVG